MKAADLRNNTLEELQRKLEDTRKKYFELRFQHASGTLKNIMDIKSQKREIARILTVLKEKEND